MTGAPRAVPQAAHGRSTLTSLYRLAGLREAGLLRDRPATTYWGALGGLTENDPTIEVRPAARWVDDGDVVTAAGSAPASTWRCTAVRLAGPDRPGGASRHPVRPRATGLIDGPARTPGAVSLPLRAWKAAEATPCCRGRRPVSRPGRSRRRRSWECRGRRGRGTSSGRVAWPPWRGRLAYEQSLRGEVGRLEPEAELSPPRIQPGPTFLVPRPALGWKQCVPGLFTWRWSNH
jgi:hypothetical protein